MRNASPIVTPSQKTTPPQTNVNADRTRPDELPLLVALFRTIFQRGANRNFLEKVGVDDDDKTTVEILTQWREGVTRAGATLLVYGESPGTVESHDGADPALEPLPWFEPSLYVGERLCEDLGSERVVAEPWMNESSSCGQALLGINLEQRANERLGGICDVVPHLVVEVVATVDYVVDDVGVDLALLVAKGRISGEEDKNHDSAAPHVAREPVWISIFVLLVVREYGREPSLSSSSELVVEKPEDFGCDVELSSRSVSDDSRILDDDSGAKVGELEGFGVVLDQKEVLGFDISVQNPLGVKRPDDFEEHHRALSSFVLRVPLALDNPIEKLSALHVLEDERRSVSGAFESVRGDDAGKRARLPQNVPFTLQGAVRRRIALRYLHRVKVARHLVPRQFDHRIRPKAEVLNHLQFLHRDRMLILRTEPHSELFGGRLAHHALNDAATLKKVYEK